MNQNGRYSFTVHQISEDGEIRLKEFNYMYLFKELGIILAVTEDITELSGKDMLTGGYNRRGFIHNSETYSGTVTTGPIMQCCTLRPQFQSG